MEFLTILAWLRRRPFVLALGILIALSDGAFVALRQLTAKPTGAAVVQALVDTPTSLLATSDPGDAETITQRSILLADFGGGRSATNTIARLARVPAGELIVAEPTFAPVNDNSLLPDGQLPQAAAQAAATATAEFPYSVDIYASYNIPIVTITANAVEPQTARALARATIDAIRAATPPAVVTPIPGRSPARSGRPAARHPGPALEVRQLGPVRTVIIPAKNRRWLLGIAAGIFVMIALWSMLALLEAVVYVWRRGRARTSAVV
jgi:hypothetical protein